MGHEGGRAMIRGEEDVQGKGKSHRVVMENMCTKWKEGQFGGQMGCSGGGENRKEQKYNICENFHSEPQYFVYLLK